MGNLERHDHAGEEQCQSHDGQGIRAEMRHLPKDMAHTGRPFELLDSLRQQHHDFPDILQPSDHKLTDAPQKAVHHAPTPQRKQDTVRPVIYIQLL